MSEFLVTMDIDSDCLNIIVTQTKEYVFYQVVIITIWHH